ncbi:hypothetical protein D3C81_1416450 [compost metagenome]
MHPQQDARGADQRQHRHQKATEGFADEFVEGIQISDQVRRDCAATKAFVFAEGNPLEAFDQTHADTVDDVLGQPCKQPRLQHAEAQRTATQGKGHQQHQAYIAGRLLPHRRQHMVHDFQRGIAMAEKDFVH